MNTQLTKQKLRFTLIASVLTLVLGIVFISVLPAIIGAVRGALASRKK